MFSIKRGTPFFVFSFLHINGRKHLLCFHFVFSKVANVEKTDGKIREHSHHQQHQKQNLPYVLYTYRMFQKSDFQIATWLVKSLFSERVCVNIVRIIIWPAADLSSSILKVTLGHQVVILTRHRKAVICGSLFHFVVKKKSFDDNLSNFL